MIYELLMEGRKRTGVSTRRTWEVPQVEPAGPGMGWMSPARVRSDKEGQGMNQKVYRCDHC